ncbi:tetratricopeptide repeat protein [Desulfomicrobium salsuginis]
MTPLFSTCTGCSHPAIKAARQCKAAMALANDGRTGEAETLLKTAMGGLRRAGMPMMKAKILNSLALVYAQQGMHLRARRCLSSSLRIVASRVGTDNWLYARIASNRDSLAA